MEATTIFLGSVAAYSVAEILTFKSLGRYFDPDFSRRIHNVKKREPGTDAVTSFKEDLLPPAYYQRGTDTTKYENWVVIVNGFDDIISELEDLKAYLRENKDNLTEAVLENAREAIVNIRRSLKNIIDLILGAL